MIKPKISIIIPIYNMASHLSQCLDSILYQTLKDIEIICIDDGSTDHSLDLLYEYQDKFNNLLIISQSNLGSGPARNNGIEHCNGQYIGFMDPDDWYPTDDILESLYNAAVTNKALICGGSLSRFDGKNIFTSLSKNETDMFFTQDGFVRYSDYQFIYGFWRFIYQRDFIISNNIQFPSYKRGQDPLFFVTAMIFAKEFYALKKVTYCYRSHYDSIKKISWDAEKTNDYARFIIDLLNISDKIGYKKLHTHSIKRYIWYSRLVISRRSYLNNSELPELIEVLNNSINNALWKSELPSLLEIILSKPSAKFLFKSNISTMIKRELTLSKCMMISILWYCQNLAIKQLYR